MESLSAARGRRWWRGRLWCPGCYGKHWLWRTVVRCDGQTIVECALILGVLAFVIVVVLLGLRAAL